MHLSDIITHVILRSLDRLKDSSFFIFRGSSAVERVAVRHSVVYNLMYAKTSNIADRAEYLKQAVTKRRQTIREKLVAYKGAACIYCGYNRCVDALDLHHVDASQKEFGISSGGLTRAWSKVIAEADKCILVCANCHREIHAGKIKVQPTLATE